MTTTMCVYEYISILNWLNYTRKLAKFHSMQSDTRILTSVLSVFGIYIRIRDCQISIVVEDQMNRTHLLS